MSSKCCFWMSINKKSVPNELSFKIVIPLGFSVTRLGSRYIVEKHVFPSVVKMGNRIGNHFF